MKEWEKMPLKEVTYPICKAGDTALPLTAVFPPIMKGRGKGMEWKGGGEASRKNWKENSRKKGIDLQGKMKRI